MEKKLLGKGFDEESAARYAEIDVTLKRLEKKMKEGSALEMGQRGSNKVSAMAEQFSSKLEPKETTKPNIPKSVSLQFFKLFMYGEDSYILHLPIVYSSY